MIKVEIIADSLHPSGKSRLTSFVLQFPRWILAEFNTHRMISRNSASSRGLPVEKMIDIIKKNPAMPEFWGKNQKGMQSNEELTGKELEEAKKIWIESRDSAITNAYKLVNIGMHKQYVNRIIENFMYTKVIATASEWENFFALRANDAAQPEFKKLAYLMLELYNNSTPKQLFYDDWHIPFGDKLDTNDIDIKLKVATARCARVSYYDFEGKSNIDNDIKLHDRLVNDGHMSPTEHCAKAVHSTIIDSSSPNLSSNFSEYWLQYRKTFSNECRKDERVQTKIPVV